MSGAVVVGEYPPPPAGLSAYELAVQQGFVGTLDEWLASLHGDAGAGVDPRFPEFTEWPLRDDWQPEWIWVFLRDPDTGEVLGASDKDGLPA